MRRWRDVLTLLFMIGLMPSASPAETPYWLQFGKPVLTCPDAALPFKIGGASWGLLASGVVLCHKTRSSYIYELQFLNVFIDPTDRQIITREILTFDWCGMTLFKPNAAGDDIDWLFEKSVPIKGRLERNSTGRIVFGNLSFEVPIAQASGATNMLFYITFQGPMVVIGAV